jgi:hypothetical protein
MGDGSMRRAKTIGYGLFIWIIVAGCGAQTQPDRTVPLARTVRLPVHTLEGTPADTTQPAQSLGVSIGAEDELPAGPQGFDVLYDGSFVVSDPLQRRLVFYDSEGAFLDAWPLNFSPTTVTVLEDGLEVHDGATDTYYLVDDRGNARPVASGTRSTRIVNELGVPRLERGENRGQISWEGARAVGPSTLEVILDIESLQLVSLGSLGTDGRGYTYAVLEAAEGGDAIHVRKLIHVFDVEGNLMAKIEDTDDDYFVHPVDAFRLRGQSVYQLVPRHDEVLIHVWNVD